MDTLSLALLRGLRFDLVAIVWLNAVVVLWHILLVGRYRWANIVGHWLFLVLNIPFLVFNFGDFIYSQYTGKRMTVGVLFLSEAMDQAGQLLVNYWYITLWSILVIVVCYKFSRRWIGQVSASYHPLRRLVWLMVSVPLLVCGWRGGIQKKNIKPIHAYSFKEFELGNLVLNSSITMLDSLYYSNRRIGKNVAYFKTREDVLKHLQSPLPIERRALGKGDNIVLIVLESFATEFWGVANSYPGYTPFLDSLAKEGLFFSRNFSNARNSMNALFAILFGVPKFIETSLIRSNYQNNRWYGLGHAMNEAGYHTSFFSAAHRGSLYFDAITALAGLGEHYSLERYPEGMSVYDGHWGAYDEPFLQFMATKLDTYSQPFFSMVFTLSSHQPYTIPPQYKGVFPTGTLKIHESVGYVDYALKRFFQTIKTAPWFKNTLFIITGDHTQMSDSQFYDTALGRFMVPLLLYHPGRELPPVAANKVTDHLDIFPTIVDYLGLEGDKLPLFGHSVFNSGVEGRALFHLSGIYWWVEKDYFLQYNPARKQALLYRYDDHEQRNPVDNPGVKSATLDHLRAHIQYFKSALIGNNLYEWRKEPGPSGAKR